MNVGIDFISFFLVDEMGNSFHYNNVLQQWHILLELTTMHVFLCPWGCINHIKIPNYKFHRYFYLCSCPWSRQLPASITLMKKIYGQLLIQFLLHMFYKGHISIFSSQFLKILNFKLI